MIKNILITTGVLLHFIGLSQSTNPAPYCNTVTNPLQGQENSSITNVQLGALNNTTGFAEGGSRYHYYNNLGPATITLGVAQVLSISFGANPGYFEPEYFACYIDFNSDNTFSANEAVFFNTLANGGVLTGAAQTKTLGFTLNAATLGNKRMRIIRGECPANSPNFTPNFTLAACPQTNPNFWLGEVEDYDLLITAPPAPVALFALSSPSACVGQTVNIIDMSTNSPTLWTWGIVGAAPVTANQQLIGVSYSNAGTYSVTLIVTNAGGVSSVYSRSLTVYPKPTITVSSAVGSTNTNSILCRGRTATLTANGASTYSWNTNATTSVIAVSPTTTINYTVTGTSQEGCKTTMVKTQSVAVCAGFNDLSENISNIKAFPNPGNGNFRVTISNASENTELQVYNALGKLIFATKAEEENTIHIEEYSDGIYFLKVMNEGALLETKLLIKN